ncbi:MAG: TRAP transporter substrate-binding protein [Melioribacteraceae bacterium]|nr:TRAP transporter substrate-binding protein [Melioribacteraceae bacterium]MCF8356982.1 TRAP transporter substrate-binding protein [Melioribacteraceae bacterium]MCF8396447.1 TRAP transporter substrate-binding protein [Melioribacteraceae bacterium]MCF8421192.1 TRAP transporter substrate-binding protein [Melioribacteraceae bacterium]
MTKIERREFIKKTAIAAAGGTALMMGCNDKKSDGTAAVVNSKTYEWKMVTAWLPNFPLLGEGAVKLARMIEKMSNNRLKITVYGGGELVPALETFDAVSQGVAEMGHSASYYWAGKAPAAQLFTSVPFGMNTQQTNAWLYNGGGLDLWKELYSKFNLIPFPAGNTGGQMGGWYNKEIKSADDFKGLKIRQPGLAGKVVTKAGAASILSPGGEIYTNLERGVIDATDWIGPYHDYQMGFHKIAKYYYYPSWSEPTGVVELMVNKNAYEQLPDDLKEIVKVCASAINNQMLGEFETKNSEYLEKLESESGIEIKKYPADVMNVFKNYTNEVLHELESSDEMSAKILESYNLFRKNITRWTNYTERQFFWEE